MTALRLTTHQAAARDRALSNSQGYLYRWPGGYWTTMPHAGSTRVTAPKWYTGWSVVDALIRKGLAEIAEHKRTAAGDIAVTVRMVEKEGARI